MKIVLNSLGPISPEQITANIESSKAFGCPAALFKKDRPPLAIVGGGRSVLLRLGELRAWRGDIWGINHAFTWLRDNGIRSRFYTADPRRLEGLGIGPDDDVLISTCSDAGMFEQCKAGYIETFEHYKNGVVPGITSAGTSLTVAMSLGYGKITYFGCESSFETDGTHIYGDDVPVDMVRVRCNAKDYLSKLEFLHQAIILSIALRGLPRLFKERSGGLLSAMASNPDWDITHGTTELYGQLRPATGLSNPWDAAAGYEAA